MNSYNVESIPIKDTTVTPSSVVSRGHPGQKHRAWEFALNLHHFSGATPGALSNLEALVTWQVINVKTLGFLGVSAHK